ncbi:unnamed protein product [Brassica napus]|uniref:(rape) hypothetical protein n=1 Tax=Brassica napus TaxID=3708 RepID=A0A816KY62_BRANA|nr:unnamed protein product [Brassica napus]
MEQFPELPLIPSLPDDLTIDIVARVPISHYPTLSLVSKSFRKLIAASPKLYKRRSQLGITQHRVYAILRNSKAHEFSFYILHNLNGYNRLDRVRSLPLISSFALNTCCVSVGSKLYVFSENSALSVDCTSHKLQSIPDIPDPISHRQVNAIGKKVHLLGDTFCDVVTEKGWSKGFRKAVAVFDTETQSWEPTLVNEDLNEFREIHCDSCVMEDKIFLKVMGGYVCVVDGVLYAYGHIEKTLVAFDPKQGYWSVVNGLKEFFALETSWWYNAVNYGPNKLALFFPKTLNNENDVTFCAEVALERRQGGEIWGEVQCCDIVISDELLQTVKLVAVTV